MKEIDFNVTGRITCGKPVKIGLQMIVKSRSSGVRAVFNEKTWKWESDDKVFAERLSKAQPGKGIKIPHAQFPMTYVSDEKTLVNVFMKILVLAPIVDIIEVPEVVADFITERQLAYRDEDYSHIEVPDCPGV